MAALQLDLYPKAAATPRADTTHARPPLGGGRSRRGGEARGARRPGAERQRGGRTLDEVLVGAWEGLLAHHPVTCPVCSAAMTPRYGSGPGPVGGRCTSCGSTLG
jgi:hypothetical protein